MSNTLESLILNLGEKNNIVELRKVVKENSASSLTDAVKASLERRDFPIFWNYLLQSFDLESFECCEKRFVCVKSFLDEILRIELNYKQVYDLINRLSEELATFSKEQLIQIQEHCIDSLRAGDTKCISWKDLLPETMRVLSAFSELNVNGILMSGQEFRNSIIHSLLVMRWPNEILTPLADMFKSFNMSSSELMTALKKFSDSLQSMSPLELPSLTFQLFSLCSSVAEMFNVLLALDKYFYRFYYKKIFANMFSNSTDYDSIDSFSDKELREAEETIVHYLNYCIQFKFSEHQICTVLKNFSSSPDIILTPFILSAILSMSSANKEPDIRLSSSPLLYFLKTIIKNNEEERKLADYSVWCRDSLQKKQVNLDEVFTIIINQNKDGKDSITPALVNFIFLLLKAKNSPELNEIAISFLTIFVRKRFLFGQGIVKRLSEWMILEQDQNQFSECLTLISVADTFTVSECVKTINYVLDFFLWIPGNQAMRMMSFVLPILKISPNVRDTLIEVLRKSMNSSNIETKRMAVYGFCMILKQLNNSNSQRSQLGTSNFFTQQSISGFSLMSQATLGSTSNPQRHFDMLTLDIIGLLRNCFTQPLIIKLTLYENLQRAVELNPKLVPHVLQFLDAHFRSYFVFEKDKEFSINFMNLIQVKDDQEGESFDNLGKLLLFVSHCMKIFDKFQTEYDVRELRSIIEMSIEKILAKELKFEDSHESNSAYQKQILAQQINFIEGLLGYLILNSKRDNENIRSVLPLFRTHQKLLDTYQFISKKGSKKSKGFEHSNNSTHVNTIGAEACKRNSPGLKNIWDLSLVERFLRLLHEDVVNFALPQSTSILRSNIELVRYVLKIAGERVEDIRNEPEYKQVTHSRRVMKYLIDITKIVYERCIRRLSSLWTNFDLKVASLSAVCFLQCLTTADMVYKKKFSDVFVKGFDFYVVNNTKDVSSSLHDIIDEFLLGNSSSQEDLMKTEEGRRIPQALFQCLEVLYDNLSFSNRMTTESYSWLMKFCKTHEIHHKELFLVHKLFFIQRQKTHSGAFFNVIASHMGKVLGNIDDSPEEEQSFNLKSITMDSVESCLLLLYATLKKQIEEIEYFIIKANNISYKIRLITDEDREMNVTNLHALERSICSQLVHVSNTFIELTNVCIPLGSLMDNLTKLLIQHYICLRNLTKHFLICCTLNSFSIEGTKFDSLLRKVGKPLSSRIYALITYIEANILDSEKKKSNPQAEKSKVLRETKFIPKLILCIENFNKHVILLGKKTNDRISNYLHLGTVRDFRIKTADLKAAIERTLSYSNEIQCNESLEENSENNGYEENNENESNDLIEANNDTTDLSDITKELESKYEDATSDAVTPENAEEIGNENNKESASQLLKNLSKINKKAKKRTLKEVEVNADAESIPSNTTKRRNTRSSKNKDNT